MGAVVHALSQSFDNRIEQPRIDRVWREFKNTGSPALRNYLVIHYMSSHVRKLARRLRTQLPPQVDVDDLVDEAYEGLVDAINRFDLDQHVRFETFSSKRLYGAMRDYLRRIDPIPRLARTRAKQAQAIIDDHQKLHGCPPSNDELNRRLRQAALDRFRKSMQREPDEQELARLMKLADASFRKTVKEGRPALIVPFSTVTGGEAASDATGSGGDAMASLEDRRASARSPLTRAETNDLRRWITQGFSRRDRLIIVLYYYEQMTMREIGNTLGCSESRVSQRLDSILDCLRARLHRSGCIAEFFGK